MLKNENFVDEVLKILTKKLVYQNLTINFIDGVKKQHSTAKFSFVNSGNKIRVAGLLEKSKFGNIKQISLRLNGFFRNGQIEKNLTVSVQHKVESKYFTRLWSIIFTNETFYPMQKNSRFKEVIHLNLLHN